MTITDPPVLANRPVTDASRRTDGPRRGRSPVDAAARRRIERVDAVVAALAPLVDDVDQDERPNEALRRDRGEIERLSDAAIEILDAAIERGDEDLHVVRALGGRRSAWLRAQRDRTVAAGIRTGGPATVAPTDDIDRWQAHLAVVERVEDGVRQIKIAIGDSALAADVELAGYERALRSLAAQRPSTPALTDALFARFATIADARPTR